jgi:hypothetical protein
MKFPIGTSFLPLILAFVIIIFMTYKDNFSFSLGASIFILVYYLLDVIFKMVLIYKNKYQLKQINR